MVKIVRIVEKVFHRIRNLNLVYRLRNNGIRIGKNVTLSNITFEGLNRIGAFSKLANSTFGIGT